ncbi:MAG TPA: hypothetical protein DDW55_10035 [Gammaproteobacteria bacterium]|nr:hypothetical protein [Gammaproteobacteria bacterium]
MKTPKKPSRKTEGLTDAIQSLQHLLDDVGTSLSTPVLKPGEAKFDETGEFEITGIQSAYTGGEETAIDIDSHFDMSIPPDLPDDERNQTDNIPTLSESIVEGDIPVLMEAVRLPGGRTIEIPSDGQEKQARTGDDAEHAISDATEAAGDAVQIILKRYRCEQLSQDARDRLEQQVRQLLENEIRDSTE